MNRFFDFPQSKRELFIQLELNRLQYTVAGNVSLLKPSAKNSSYYPQLSYLNSSASEFSQLVTDLILLSPDVKLHQSNIKALQIELMSYRFEGTLAEQRALIGAILSLCQQIRVSIYY